MAARDLGIDSVEFRRRNLVAEAEMPYAIATVTPSGAETEYDSGDYRITLDRCLREIGWVEKQNLQGRLIDGRYHGLAVGCFIEGGAAGPKETARLVARSRRPRHGLGRLGRRRARARDRVRADRGRRARSCRWRASRRPPRLDVAAGGRLRRLPFALDRDGRLGDRGGGRGFQGGDP